MWISHSAALFSAGQVVQEGRCHMGHDLERRKMFAMWSAHLAYYVSAKPLNALKLISLNPFKSALVPECVLNFNCPQRVRLKMANGCLTNGDDLFALVELTTVCLYVATMYIDCWQKFAKYLLRAISAIAFFLPFYLSSISIFLSIVYHLSIYLFGVQTGIDA